MDQFPIFDFNFVHTIFLDFDLRIVFFTQVNLVILTAGFFNSKIIKK